MQTGDLVELKSGGPMMTVSYQASTSSLGAFWRCVWFDNDEKLCEGLFLEKMLLEGDDGDEEEFFGGEQE